MGRVAPCGIQTLTQTLISISPISAELLFYQENFNRVLFSIFFFQCKGFQVDVILLKALFSEVTVQEKKNLEKIMLLFNG